MEVSEITNAVRWCIDEESNNLSDITGAIDGKDDSYMDNIIKANIPYALHWIAITAASSSVLSGSSTTENKSTSSTTTASTTSTMKVESFEGSSDIGVVTMPNTISVFNINRVRANGWHKAVVPIEDTDDEELMMFDETAKGTLDRPLAAIMRVNPIQILIQPKPSDNAVTISYVGVPTGISKDNKVEISETFKGAFIHYLAFLLLSAYDDTKANQMYTIALQLLGVNNQAK